MNEPPNALRIHHNHDIFHIYSIHLLNKITNLNSTQCLFKIMSWKEHSRADRANRELEEMKDMEVSITDNVLDKKAKKQLRRKVANDQYEKELEDLDQNRPPVSEIIDKIFPGKCINCGNKSKFSRNYFLEYGKIVDFNKIVPSLYKTIKTWSYIPVGDIQVNICYKCILTGESERALKRLIEVQVGQFKTHPKDADILVNKENGKVIRVWHIEGVC